MNKALAAFGAAIVFFVLRGVLDFGFIGAIIVTGFTYTGITAISEEWPRRLKDRLGRLRPTKATPLPASDSTPGERDTSYLDRIPELAALGISREEFDDALREGSRKLVLLRKAAARVSDSHVRGKAHGVCDAAARILSEIRQDPADLRKARNFLDYYLEATINVVERYVSLSARGVKTPEMQSALQRAEASLDTIRSAYDKQLVQLLENDVMDLDVELRVLERTIEMEGLGDS
jgi:5-bromo-4-chloroindolyl phosphate hydrolysis protein